MNRTLRALSLASCMLLASCSSCLDLVDCSGDYLFQDWQNSGTSGPPYLDLSDAHFGAGQPFYIGACAYLVDIESNDDGLSGTFSLSRPEPDSAACISQETTQTWVMTCSSLVVTTPAGSTTFAPPPDPTDAN